MIWYVLSCVTRPDVLLIMEIGNVVKYTFLTFLELLINLWMFVSASKLIIVTVTSIFLMRGHQYLINLVCISKKSWRSYRVRGFTMTCLILFMMTALSILLSQIALLVSKIENFPFEVTRNPETIPVSILENLSSWPETYKWKHEEYDLIMSIRPNEKNL